MTALFDADELMSRIGNDTAFLKEIVQMLSEDGRVLMDKVRDAAASGDAALLGTSAHTLKGMISNFCAPGAVAAAFELEKMGRAGDLAGAPAAVKALDGQLEALIVALNEFLAARV
jgi:two-component system, sensor histidine kinase and response regulator